MLSLLLVYLIHLYEIEDSLWPYNPVSNNAILASLSDSETAALGKNMLSFI